MAANRVELLKQICPECTKQMHKRCVNAANDGRDPCKECNALLCNNRAALVACYDLCEKCNSKICSDCHVKAQKKNLNANFDKKCYDLLCKRCLHVLQCWCVRGIKTHLNELGISDSSSESESDYSSDSGSSGDSHGANSPQVPANSLKTGTKSAPVKTKHAAANVPTAVPSAKPTSLKLESVKLDPIKLEHVNKVDNLPRAVNDLSTGMQKLSVDAPIAQTSKPKGIVGNGKNTKKSNKKH